MASNSDYEYDFHRSAVSEETKSAFGTVTAAAAIGTDVAVITDPGASGGRGWYKIWGHLHSNVADSMRLAVGASVKADFAHPANNIVYFGPYMAEITNDTDDIIIETRTATSTTGAATVYAKRMADA